MRTYIPSYVSSLCQIFVLVTYGRGLDLLWRHCDTDTLCILLFLWAMSCLHNAHIGQEWATRKRRILVVTHPWWSVISAIAVFQRRVSVDRLLAARCVPGVCGRNDAVSVVHCRPASAALRLVARSRRACRAAAPTPRRRQSTGS